tara:strand:- start:497 stop:958 length:462 start_codon:yes stop_codon:yes gene_type:complete
MNIIRFIFFFCILNSSVHAQSIDIQELNQLLDKWHQYATDANFNAYFDFTTDDFIFLGTDPTERWGKKEFMTFSKPYFDKGEAWDFKCTERNWVLDYSKNMIWFDETLNTWMNTCRGSGILLKVNDDWKLVYYNLTVLIENEKIKGFIELRKQ